MCLLVYVLKHVLYALVFVKFSVILFVFLFARSVDMTEEAFNPSCP